MSSYPKIYGPFKRDPGTHKVKYGEWTLPVFDYLQNNQWEFTEKLDGANICIYPETGLIYGRADRVQIPTQFHTYLQSILEDEDKNDELFYNFGKNLSLFGEGIGPGIQKGGGNYCDHQKFVLFDAHTDWGWLSREYLLDIGVILDIPCTPLVMTGTLCEGISLVSHGLESKYGYFQAGGIIGRPVHEFDECIRIKIKGQDFNCPGGSGNHERKNPYLCSLRKGEAY